jgi:uroporphyrin-III C-methyltransferase
MPGRRFRQLAEELMEAGIAPQTPCVAVSNASTPEEHVHRATLATLSDDAVGPAPVILLIGNAIRPAK